MGWELIKTVLPPLYSYKDLNQKAVLGQKFSYFSNRVYFTPPILILNCLGFSLKFFLYFLLINYFFEDPIFVLLSHCKCILRYVTSHSSHPLSVCYGRTVKPFSCPAAGKFNPKGSVVLSIRGPVL